MTASDSIFFVPVEKLIPLGLVHWLPREMEHPLFTIG